MFEKTQKMGKEEGAPQQGMGQAGRSVCVCPAHRLCPSLGDELGGHWGHSLLPKEMGLAGLFGKWGWAL